MAEAAGRAVKVISMLLPDLPTDRHYQVLFMVRPIEEVAASQARMLERRGQGASDPTAMVGPLRAHFAATVEALTRSTRVTGLAVPYRQLITDPEACVRKIVEFLGPDRVPHPERMAGVIRPELYRQKQPPTR